MKRSLWWVGVVASVVMFSAAVGAVTDPDELIPGKKTIIKPAKLAKVISKGTFAFPSATNDPTIGGGTVRFFDTIVNGGAGDNTYNLPAGGWSGLGNPPGVKGFKYKGAGTPADPCKVVLVKDTTIKAVCKGTGVSLVTPFAGDVGFILTLGPASKRYCATFGGTLLKNDDKLTKRKDAVAAASCAAVLPTQTATQTFTPTNTRTVTSTATNTATRTETGTATNTPTATSTRTATNTGTATGTATNTPTATSTRTGTNTATSTVTRTPTNTPTATPSATPPPTPLNVGTHSCVLGPTSALNLGTQALPLNLSPAGSLSIACGTTDPLGKAACNCDVVSIGALVIPAIGDVCVSPAPCPAGEIDCNGGNAMNVDLVADHNIGTCTSDTACGTACNGVCAGLGANYARVSYGCEGFCQGGSNNNNPCTLDANCPGGSCTGRDPVTHAGTCNCACQGEGLGGASPAGSLSCQVGTQINVELAPTGICGDAAPNIILPPVCGAVTTTTATGVILDANNTALKTIPPIGGVGTPPNTQTGASIACSTVASSTLTGVTLVGHLGFPDSTLGDIFAANKFVCQ